MLKTRPSEYLDWRKPARKKVKHHGEMTLSRVGYLLQLHLLRDRVSIIAEQHDSVASTKLFIQIERL
jgi:hypothetical protein